MSTLGPLSLDHPSFVLVLIVLSSMAWAISSLWPSSSFPSSSSPSFYYSTLTSTIVLFSSVLVYYYHHLYYRQRNHHSSTGRITLPDFISIECLGKTIATTTTSSTTVPETKSRHAFSILPPFLFSSLQPSVTSTRQQEQSHLPSECSPSTPLPRIEVYQERKGLQCERLDVLGQTEIESNSKEEKEKDKESLKHESIPTHSTSPPPGEIKSNQTSSVEIIPKEILEALWTHPDYRIWDHIVVGDGYEALESARRLAQQYPTKTILVLLEIDVKPNGVKGIVQQWTRRILATLAQQLWVQEALKAVPALLHDLSRIFLTDESLESTFERSNSLDMSSLPSNICIGPKIRATRILIDKPITPQNITISNPRPIRRFSSFKGTTDLTINTSTITPSRTIGLEVASIEDSKGARCQLFCKNNIVFVNDKHPLVQSLDTTKSPPMSRDGIISPSGRRMSTQTSDDRSQLRKMTFSIRMQYRRQKENSSNMLILTLYHLLQSTSLFIDRLLSSSDGLREQSTTTTKSQETKSLFDFHPVILHQSQRIVHNGRVGDIQPDDDSDETLCLEISASTTSMEISAPIQILVKVETQPTVQDAFGNTDMIRKGETVLMEGLGLAREMAHTAGWSCLEEDDSRMVEWVRDQMNIKWSSERQPSTFLPVSTALEGLQTVTRLRTLSTSSLRIKTPNLSPYPSRTHSFNGKRRESPGSGDRRDSTLKRLQDVTETLQQHEQEKQRIEEEDNNSSASKVTIAAATVESGEPQRPGLKTSFSGFSSLNNSRIQSLTLAEETEDHLGMSLSISPSNGSTGVKGQTLSPPPPPPPKEQLDTFNDCIEPLDFLGMNADKQVSPKPKALSRFSIKSYQLERSNHGLGDEWAIGGNFSNTLGASTTTKSDFLTTPPLIADQSLSGTVSPLTPSPEGVPVTDFLQGLSPPKLYVPVNRFNYNGGSSRMGSGVGVGLGVGKGGEELFNSPNQDGNINDNGSRRLSSIGSFSNLGSATKNGIAPLQSEKQYEATQDFLGESFGTSPIPAFKSKYDGTYNKQGLSFLPTEIEKDLLTPTNLGVTATTTTKTVQFADTEQFDDSMTSSAESQSLSDNSFNSSSSSSLSSLENSKFKAHTRRSWGQGIGGSDILGIQGLS